MKLILAQGNPGIDYALSRHNAGFMILDTLALKMGAKWTDKPKFNAMTTELEISGQKTLLIKPTTYYNETGISAQKIINFYKLDPANSLMVIHDDLNLPFGSIRVRKQGSDGGNNGIRSLNAYIGEDYTRIRIGTFNETREQMNDVDFVIGKFNSTESKQFTKTIIPQVIQLIERFCNDSIDHTSYKVG